MEFTTKIKELNFETFVELISAADITNAQILFKGNFDGMEVMFMKALLEQTSQIERLITVGSEEHYMLFKMPDKTHMDLLEKFTASLPITQPRGLTALFQWSSNKEFPIIMDAIFTDAIKHMQAERLINITQI